MNINKGRPLEMPAEPIRTEEPIVADNIIFATNPREAKQIADELGLPFDQVQWYRSADLLGDVDVTESAVHYSAAFTHRPDYPATRDRVKVKTGKGRRANPGKPETAGRTAVK